MSRLETLKTILKENTGDTFARYALALELISSGLIEEAEVHFKYILENSPDYLAVYYQYGKLLEESGDTEAARSIYETGITLAEKQKDLHTKSELQDALDNLF